MYDKAFIGSFQQLLECFSHHNGHKRKTSREKTYPELGLESLQDRRWYRKLCFL